VFNVRVIRQKAASPSHSHLCNCIRVTNHSKNGNGKNGNGKLGCRKIGQPEKWATKNETAEKKWQQKINVGNTDNRINGNGKKTVTENWANGQLGNGKIWQQIMDHSDIRPLTSCNKQCTSYLAKG